MSFLQVQAGQVRRPGLLAGQRAGALQRVRAVIVSAKGKLGKLLQKQRLIPAKEDVAVFHVRLSRLHPHGLILRGADALNGQIEALPGGLPGQLLL